jgi:hypothetical protein
MNTIKLFLASFIALYFELVLIRYLSTEIRIFAYLKNLPLIASFFGIGYGMVIGRTPAILRRLFPLFALLLFLPIIFAAPLNLTHITFATTFQDYMFGMNLYPNISQTLKSLLITLSILSLVVLFFIVLGGLISEQLSLHKPLPGYGVNLLGSLTGILAFTALSFYNLPPFVWLSLGFLLLGAFFIKQKMAVASFAVIVLMAAIPQPNCYWSPYYRIDFKEYSSLPDPSRPSAYMLSVNHDYHQKIVDLSTRFISDHPGTEPNRSALSTYELPYYISGRPGEVLIVGAGTGNDVAAALRHGALHVDAVEIDPVIQRLGSLYHPEKPYESTKVTAYIDDARAFFKKTKKKYDLIIFGYLDAHTLLSGFSSLRLDNYVYTRESFCEARDLLTKDGTVVLAFDSGNTFVTDRIFATLEDAFGVPPHAYTTNYDSAGMVFVEGKARGRAPITMFPEVGGTLSQKKGTLIATDHWPFLYLSSRTIPISVIAVFVLFLSGAWITMRRTLPLQSFADRQHLHFFLLGAGFLLLETKGVTEMSLLFGSTWLTNALVIGAFLVMAILANIFIFYRQVPARVSYSGLFVLLVISLFFPYAMLDALPQAAKIAAAGVIVGLPVFFTGLIFSRSFREVAYPSQALGINLFGAVIGGVLENTVTIGGTAILGIMAVVIYALSAICYPATRQN